MRYCFCFICFGLGFLCVLFFGYLVSLSEVENQNKTDLKGQFTFGIKVAFSLPYQFWCGSSWFSFNLKQTLGCCVKTSGSDFVEVAQKLPFLSMEAECHV